MNTQQHIDRKQVALLLDEASSKSIPQHVTQHLEECPQCREQLEQAAADPSWWSCVENLSDDDLHSTLGSPLVDGPPASSARRDFSDLLDPPSHPELLGQLNQFEIERLIGQGGMGVVFKGFDRELHRTVAIKLMSPHLAHNATARKRFEREARAAAAVVHPNVIPIYGVSQSKDQPFIVMPLISGKSLQAHVEQHGPFETKDVVRIGMQIAAGLAAAHQQGLVHRDIKPANILLEQDVSRVVITDFGLARAADELAMTQTGWLAGTPHYMSPEQARGAAIDTRSDLFSLGGVLYFIATGREPFRADKPVAVLHKICSESAAPARQINSDIPQTLSDIIERLLEKNPADRFHSAARAQKLLEDYLAELQQPNRNLKLIRVVTRRQIRRRWQIVRYVALVAALVPIMLWGQSYIGRSNQTAAPSGSSPSALGSPVAPIVQPPISSKLSGLLPPDQFNSQLGELEREIQAAERALDLKDAALSGPPSMPQISPKDGSNHSPWFDRIRSWEKTLAFGFFSTSQQFFQRCTYEISPYLSYPRCEAKQNHAPFDSSSVISDSQSLNH